MWVLIGLVVLLMWLSFVWITWLHASLLKAKCMRISRLIREDLFRRKYTRKEKNV